MTAERPGPLTCSWNNAYANSPRPSLYLIERHYIRISPGKSLLNIHKFTNTTWISLVSNGQLILYSFYLVKQQELNWKFPVQLNPRDSILSWFFVWADPVLGNGIVQASGCNWEGFITSQFCRTLHVEGVVWELNPCKKDKMDCCIVS